MLQTPVNPVQIFRYYSIIQVRTDDGLVMI